MENNKLKNRSIEQPKNKGGNTIKKTNWRKLGIEFLSILIAVTSAFGLNNWNENRRDYLASNKILAEISNGLTKDILALWKLYVKLLNRRVHHPN